MNRRLVPLVAAALVAVLVFSLVPAPADARVETRAEVHLGGALGKVAKLFGGTEVATVEIVSGDRMLTRTGRHGRLVDLGERKTWTIDFKRNRVTEVRTFDEIRELHARVREALEQEAAEREEESGETGEGETAPTAEVEVSVEDTGETDTILGHEARKKLVKVVAHPAGTTLEKGGGAVLEAELWIGPELAPLEEVAAFQRRYAEATGILGEDLPDLGSDPTVLEVVNAFERAAEDWKGSLLRSRMTVWTVPAPGTGQSGGLRGMLGRLGRKRRKKAAQDGPEGGRLVMRTVSEVTAISSEVPAGALDLPGGGS